ncbi:MFS transporter [Streptomyces sp. CA-111067]|uniref:MFS transporter n=1 Tax=Streptomyces sp. CA-111067 TaxID=3240046 RepID=UPI003D99CCDD
MLTPTATDDCGRTSLGPRFHQVWASVTVSSFGDGMRFVALPLIAARLTSDPRQIAAVALAEELPWLLVGLVSGALADRIDRRRMLWTVDALRALVVGALAVAVGTGAATIPLLAAGGFLLGCGQTLYNGGWSGMVPALVGPASLTRANARLQTGVLISDTLLGTPLGAVLFGVAGALPLFLDAGSFVLAAGLVLLLSGDFSPRGAEPGAGPRSRSLRGLGHDVGEGIRWLWRHRLLRRLCGVAGASSLVGGGLTAILVLYARDLLGLGSLGFAVLVASFAVGGIGGASLAPVLTDRFGSTAVLRAVTFAAAAAAVCIASARSGAVACVGIAGYGAASLCWNVAAVSLRQTLVPSELLGRVTMAYQMTTGSAGAAGAAAAGVAAHAYGLRTPFAVGAGLLLGAALLNAFPLALTTPATR